jgi:hypothetical protein
MDDEVGAQATFVGIDRLLFAKIAVREHPGKLDHAS